MNPKELLKHFKNSPWKNEQDIASFLLALDGPVDPRTVTQLLDMLLNKRLAADAGAHGMRVRVFAKIAAEVEETAARRLILELGGIDKMDTAGAAVLAEAMRVGENRGMQVLLCSPSESVLQIFKLAGFADVLDHCCAGWEETRRRLTE